MYISHAEITGFRALETVSIPLSKFSVLIGENDVGKTSFLFALDKFFSGKKLDDKVDWFKENITKDIRIVLTFSELPPDDALTPLTRSNGTVVVSKVFPFGQAPSIKAILEDNSAVEISKPVLSKWFSTETFHFIPVRRDLAVQFSMSKTALLGKLLRASMKEAIKMGGGADSLRTLQQTLSSAIDQPREVLERFVQEQLQNDTLRLGFENLEIDPVEGVSFDACLSDDRVENVLVQNRGAGTQNHLIIALFRLIASSHVNGHFTFAMEEPENSLHPKAQRQLLSVIQKISSTVQVLVTTHSPVFIDRSKFENNILLTRTAQGNTVAKTFKPEDLSTVRTDLGIRASDALLKGGGNCAILVEGNTEEDGFPIFMEMLGFSEFKLGIAIINMGGSDRQKVESTARLLNAYDIPCVIVLDKDAEACAIDIRRAQVASLPNVKEVFCLTRGTIEDYYPLEIVAEVINSELSPKQPVSASDFDESKHGDARLKDFKKVMYEHGSGDSIEYLKSVIGGIGTRLLKERGMEIDGELRQIIEAVNRIATTGK